MKTSDRILLILAFALLLGMILTALFGRGSRHGYGLTPAGGNPTFLVGFGVVHVTFC